MPLGLGPPGMPGGGSPHHSLAADHKWLTRVCAAAVIADTLIRIDPQYPVPGPDQRRELRKAKAELEAEASVPGR